MTPEELRTYLVIRRFDEDVVHNVIVDFLASTIPIRYPKAWGWKAAQRYTAARQRAGNRHVQLSSTLIDRRARNPEQYAEVRESLVHAFQHPPKPKKGRPRGGGMTGWHEDYQILKSGL